MYACVSRTSTSILRIWRECARTQLTSHASHSVQLRVVLLPNHTVWFAFALVGKYEQTYQRAYKLRLYIGLSTGGGDRTSKIYDCQNFKRVSTGVPVTFKHVSRESPTFQIGVHGSKRKSPSLKRVDGKTIQSGDPNI
jgi:hypothetical protein